MSRAAVLSGTCISCGDSGLDPAPAEPGVVLFGCHFSLELPRFLV